MKKKLTLNITYSAVCLALCLVLPFLTGQLQQIGNMLCPMHLPVLLCGFLCGAPYGAIVGFVAPLLRFALFGSPVLYPIGIAMSFELCAYGLCAGLFYRLFPKKIIFIYLSLFISMILGRLVWGGVRFCIATLSHTSFTFYAFFSGAFINASIGIAIQVVLVPLIVIALKKAKLIPSDMTSKG